MKGALVLVLLSTLLSPSAARADESAPTRRVLVLDLERGGGVSDDDARTLTTMVAAAISREPGLSVIAGEDVRRMLELEGQKQNAGCDGEASCLAELAGALAAEWIVFGQASTLGDEMVVNLTLFDAAKVEAVNRASVRGPMSSIGSRVERGALVLVGGDVPPPWALLGGISTAAAAVVLGGGAVVVGLVGSEALNDASELSSEQYRQVQLGTLAGAGALGVVAVASLVGSGWLFYVAASE